MSRFARDYTLGFHHLVVLGELSEECFEAPFGVLFGHLSTERSFMLNVRHGNHGKSMYIHSALHGRYSTRYGESIISRVESEVLIFSHTLRPLEGFPFVSSTTD